MEREQFLSAVYLIVKNEQNEILFQRRQGTKLWPGFLALPAGHVDTGENVYDAVVREAKEELNVDLDKSKGKLIGSAKRFFEGCNDILDVWLFESNVSLNNIKLQKEEVCDCMWASSEKIKELYNKGEFDANPYFDEIVGEKNVEN